MLSEMIEKKARLEAQSTARRHVGTFRDAVWVAYIKIFSDVRSTEGMKAAVYATLAGDLSVPKVLEDALTERTLRILAEKLFAEGRIPAAKEAAK